MKTALRLEGEIAEDGSLHVDLPPELPRGRVVLTLELAPEDDLELTDEDLHGQGLTAREIASSPEVGSWAGEPMVPDGAEYVAMIRGSRKRHTW